MTPPIRHLEYTRARLVRESERLRALVYPETAPPDELLVAGPVDRISPEEARGLDYRPAVPGERFGPLWATFWLRFRATVPEGWDGRRVDLLFTSLSEATLWREGRVVQGLNTGGAGERPDAVLTERARAGEELSCEIELACNGMFGRRSQARAEAELVDAKLALFDEDAWRLYFDFETLRALEREPDLDPAWAGKLRAELNRFCNEPDPAILAALYEHRNGSHAHALAAIGHAHLDTAWLWPLAETYRKALRSFSSQVRYMDDYPEHRFACSQAVQLAWVEERNPDLWRRIREKVDAGQFVPVGGAWVEPDCNLPSGESLVRQFLHGQRFYESRFGRRCREFWCPDGFGYAGQLPQIMREAGISRFLTQKLSWNRFDKPEHHTFVWQGDDGSEVLGHFPPADNYSSNVTVPELAKAKRQYLDHEQSETSLLVFGHGDGGGGPTKDMLETLRRARDLQGLPRTRTVTSDEFFEALEAEPAERPVVVGELYLEYHRGTYTSQAAVKRGNRRCETLLHDAEFLSCLVGGEYPRAELDRLWKLLLLQQFHDILPGSSITLVYEDAARDFAEVEAGAAALVAAALPAGALPVNTTPFPRHEVAEAPDGRLVVAEAPPYGIGAIVEPDDAVSADGLVLENRQLRAELGADGSIRSLVDLATGRETLAAPGNRLELYDDRPTEFDAWDVDPFHLQTRRDAPPAGSWEIVRSEPLRGEIAFERPLSGRSRMRQVVRLDAGSRRLELRTEVDWHEERTMLKVCFPLAVRAKTATYETAFGFAERPTHFSTSFDAARFEVPGHRFADLSEHGFGAAVLTDSKYGYSCFGNELRISLLRSPKSPDPECDMGRHVFAYALLPHAGGWREAGVVAEARRFNQPLHWSDGEPGSFASVDDPNLVLDTIKRAEGSDDLVLRLYECHGGRGVARVRLALPFATARRANVLEDDGDPLEVEGGEIVVPYRPHELVTIRVSW
ncbi:MAG TPA: glycoside hydrolase family 38 C-terminal domain-containing protein [Gaiellaceae bacterium]|nr:glycoside hydrolase family 38 C-terminal domain-containing protein [Gaiellaceae bacterium]